MVRSRGVHLLIALGLFAILLLIKDPHYFTIDNLKVALLTSCPMGLNADDTPSVSVGSFTVGLVGAPANDKVSINVNGTQHAAAAGDSGAAAADPARQQRWTVTLTPRRSPAGSPPSRA